MKKIKISAGLSHADYAHLADLVKESTEVGIDYIHADAADMEVLRDLQLMGGHQIVQAIRPHTHLPIEVHAYLNRIDETFIDSIAEAGANMLILNIEPYMGAPLAYIMDRCRRLGMKFGVTLTCFTPLVFAEEAVYEIDRLHLTIHGINNEEFIWRRSQLPMIKAARKLIDERNPDCELAVDGGIRADNLEELVEAGPDVVVASSAIYKHPGGIKAGYTEFRKAIDDAAEKYNVYQVVEGTSD